MRSTYKHGEPNECYFLHGMGRQGMFNIDEFIRYEDRMAALAKHIGGKVDTEESVKKLDSRQAFRPLAKTLEYPCLRLVAEVRDGSVHVPQDSEAPALDALPEIIGKSVVICKPLKESASGAGLLTGLATGPRNCSSDRGVYEKGASRGTRAAASAWRCENVIEGALRAASRPAIAQRMETALT